MRITWPVRLEFKTILRLLPSIVCSGLKISPNISIHRVLVWKPMFNLQWMKFHHMTIWILTHPFFYYIYVQFLLNGHIVPLFLMKIFWVTLFNIQQDIKIMSKISLQSSVVWENQNHENSWVVTQTTHSFIILVCSIFIHMTVYRHYYHLYLKWILSLNL